MNKKTPAASRTMIKYNFSRRLFDHPSFGFNTPISTGFVSLRHARASGLRPSYVYVVNIDASLFKKGATSLAGLGPNDDDADSMRHRVVSAIVGLLTCPILLVPTWDGKPGPSPMPSNYDTASGPCPTTCTLIEVVRDQEGKLAAIRLLRLIMDPDWKESLLVGLQIDAAARHFRRERLDTTPNATKRKRLAAVAAEDAAGGATCPISQSKTQIKTSSEWIQSLAVYAQRRPLLSCGDLRTHLGRGFGQSFSSASARSAGSLGVAECCRTPRSASSSGILQAHSNWPGAAIVDASRG